MLTKCFSQETIKKQVDENESAKMRKEVSENKSDKKKKILTPGLDVFKILTTTLVPRPRQKLNHFKIPRKVMFVLHIYHFLFKNIMNWVMQKCGNQ